MDIKFNRGVVVFGIRKFVEELGQHLISLIEYLSSETLRAHPVWGELLPYSVSAYGEGSSLGHCVRPDIVLTPEGPKVCELDFVPSGRGWVLAALPEESMRKQYLRFFEQWYKRFGAGPVYYATGTVTTCREETQYFADQLRSVMGVPISAINIDEDPPHEGLIDRLFYRSECTRYEQNGVQVITKEPFLDSKMIFALVHDPAMEKELVNAMGLRAVLFLRRAFIESYPFSVVADERPALLAQAIQDHKQWVLKNTDVESNTCWGSRGVMIGRKYTCRQFCEVADLLSEGRSMKGKDLGAHPILQRFAPSRDFSDVWNAFVKGELLAPHGALFGHPNDDAVLNSCAKDHVYARLGPYILINRRMRSSFVTPYGLLTLRQDELAHGASDALIAACRFD